MKIIQLTPVIYTGELQETVDFYTKILGFTCTANETDWGWAKVESNHVDLMISEPNEHIPFDKPTFTGSFYFQSEDVDKIWEKLKGQVRICYPIENFEYGMREVCDLRQQWIHFAIWTRNSLT